MNRSLLSGCEHEAEKVQYWIERDKNSLFARLIRESLAADFLCARKCDPLKIPKIPNSREFLEGNRIFSKKKVDKAKKRSISLRQLQHLVSSVSEISALTTHCCVSQKCGYLIAEGESASDISPERVVKQWELKGHFYAFKKLKTLATLPTDAAKPHHVVPISSSKGKDPASENQEIWEELIRSKENRLFHIGRGIKFLVD
jgi:hypothetical protein